MASTIIGLVIELRLDKCRGTRRAGAKFTTLVQIRQKKTEPALTALSGGTHSASNLLNFAPVRVIYCKMRAVVDLGFHEMGFIKFLQTTPTSGQNYALLRS